MRIVLAAAEIAPFAKGGGMADVTSYLCIDWNKLGHEVLAVLPYYRSIDEKEFEIKATGLKFEVPMGFINETAEIYKANFPDSDASVYLIGHEDYFDEEYIYGDIDDYADNDRRFIFFNRAVPELCKHLEFKPDIIHCHDFHTAFILAFLKTYYKEDECFKNTAGVFTIHNLAYQGKFNKYRIMDFTGYNLKDFDVGSWFEHEGEVNFIKTGIMYADKITTVSPTYSDEIKIPYYSEGLQDIINSRLRDIEGVLNGVYYEEWSPRKDNYISTNYNIETLEYKEENKAALLKEFHFDVKKCIETPIVSIISRLTEQKGIDLLQNIIGQFLDNNKFILAILGEGEERYEEFCSELKDKFPNNVLLRLEYNEELAHRILAGSDYLLMPSRFEPCGLTQMYAQKYGVIPIVRKTGGLSDTVENYFSEKMKGNGFVFEHYSPDDLSYAMKRALEYYKVQPHWDKLRENAMNVDNSSVTSAEKYLKLFKDLIDDLEQNY